MEQVTPTDNLSSELSGRTFVVNVNEKGRMTLPVEVRRMLQMPAEPGKVELAVSRDGAITIQGRLPTVAEMAGSVPPLKPELSWDEVEAIVRDERAEQYQNKFNR